MKLIFVRHGDPDYIHDSLTPRGVAEAEALRRRVAGWPAFDAYVSPLGRAQETARRTLAGRPEQATATTLPWLQEFRGRLPDGACCWDLPPSVYGANPALRDAEGWAQCAFYAGTNVAAVHAESIAGLDAFLDGYGYHRGEGVYHTDAATKQDAVAVLFCHMVISEECIAHLLNIAAPILWQQNFLPPTSVTVLGTEEKETGFAQWRAQCFGDVRHLHDAGLEVSPSGYFTTLFEG